MSVAITTDEMFDACFRLAAGGGAETLPTHFLALQKVVQSIGVTAPRKLQSAARKGSKHRTEGDPVVIVLSNGDKVEAIDTFEGLHLVLSRGETRISLRIVFYSHRFVATIRDVAGDFDALMDVVVNFTSSRRELVRAMGGVPAKRRSRPRLTIVPSDKVAA